MTAFGVALQLGYAPSAIVEALRDVPAVPVACSVYRLKMMEVSRCM